MATLSKSFNGVQTHPLLACEQALPFGELQEVLRE